MYFFDYPNPFTLIHRITPHDHQILVKFTMLYRIPFPVYRA